MIDEPFALFVYADGTLRQMAVPYAPTILVPEHEHERMPIVRDGRTFWSEPEHLWVITFRLAYAAGDPPRRVYHQVSEEQWR